MLKEGYAKHAVHEKVMEKLERNHCMQCVHYARYHHLIKNSLQNVAGAGRPHIVLQSARNPTGSSIKRCAKIKLLSIHHFWITTSQSESIVFI